MKFADLGCGLGMSGHFVRRWEEEKEVTASFVLHFCFTASLMEEDLAAGFLRKEKKEKKHKEKQRKDEQNEEEEPQKPPEEPEEPSDAEVPCAESVPKMSRTTLYQP